MKFMKIFEYYINFLKLLKDIQQQQQQQAANENIHSEFRNGT